MKRFWAEWITREAIRIIKRDRLGEILLEKGEISLNEKEMKKLKRRLIKIPLIELTGKDKKAIVPMGCLKGNIDSMIFSEIKTSFYFLLFKNGRLSVYVHTKIPREVYDIIDSRFLKNRVKNMALIYWISDLQKHPLRVIRDLKILSHETSCFENLEAFVN